MDNNRRDVTVKHTKIEFKLGASIDDCVESLLAFKERGILAYGEFNGKSLYSDSVTIDSAYLLITGNTKSECDKHLEESRENYERRKKEHTEKIPDLSKTWIEKGRAILTEDKWEQWEKIVPIRLNDMYDGMELSACLDIVKILNTGGSLDDAKEMIESQGHSGMSFNLVRWMVRSFAAGDRGDEFFEYLM